MDVQALFLAKYAEQTGDGLLSIVGAGLANVQIESVPFVFRSLAIVGKILLDPDEMRTRHSLKVRLLDPAGDLTFETEEFETPVTDFVQDSEYLNINLALTMTNVSILTAGRYWLEMYLDGKLIKKTPMLVKLRTHEEPQPAPEPHP